MQWGHDCTYIVIESNRDIQRLLLCFSRSADFYITDNSQYWADLVQGHFNPKAVLSWYQNFQFFLLLFSQGHPILNLSK